MNRSFPASKVIVLEVKAMLVMCCRAGNPLFRSSYCIPPPSTGRGMMKAVLHSNFVFPVPIRIEYLKPIQTVNLPQWMYRNSRLGEGGGRSKIGPFANLKGEKPSFAPTSAIYLYDQHYRFHVDLRGAEARKVRQFENRLRRGGFDSPPYLGTRECGVEITYPVVDPLPVDTSVNLIEPSLPIGLKPETMVVRNGVVDFPPDTFDRLLALSESRYGHGGQGA